MSRILLGFECNDKTMHAHTKNALRQLGFDVRLTPYGLFRRRAMTADNRPLAHFVVAWHQTETFSVYSTLLYFLLKNCYFYLFVQFHFNLSFNYIRVDVNVDGMSMLVSQSSSLYNCSIEIVSIHFNRKYVVK